MNEKIIRPGVVKRIVDLTKSRNQPYTQEVVNDILTAFFDVVEDAISNGNSINLNGYLTIETQYRKERKARNVHENTEIIVPEHYKVNIKVGSKFNQAAERYTEKQLKGK
ncbi:MAG: HU family DNA-binding protein [Lachnospiraceae bacterium]|nr:HU family DNA-binding protein [Lachnospiraceae bacterium]